MAANKIAAVFTDRASMEKALETLQHAGFGTEEVSLLLKQSEANQEFAQEDGFIEHTVAEAQPVGTVVADSAVSSDTPAVPLAEVIDPVTLSMGHVAPNQALTVQPMPDDAPGAPFKVTESPQAVARPGVPVETIVDTDVAITPPQAALKDPHALAPDAAIGGLLGLLAGTAILMIPGLGPVLAVGPIAGGLAMLTGTAALGAGIGAMAGLLSDEGIPSDRVDFYREAFDAGQGIILLAPKDRSTLNSAYNLLASHHPEHIEMLDA